MARKQTIEHLFHNTLKEKIAFGESKHLAKQNLGFAESSYKIFSYSTYNTYLKECKAFADWLKNTKGISKAADLTVTEQYAKEYLQARIDGGVSVYTVKMERSALSMLYSKPIGIKMPVRDNKSIYRSRQKTTNDKHHSRNGKYKDLFTVALATGGRRCDIERITVNSFREIDGSLYVEFKQSKGGRDRLTPVRAKYSEQVKEIVEQAKTKGKTRLFGKIPNKIDIHSLRREYAQNLYRDIVENPELRDKYLKQYPSRNEEVKRQIYKDRDGNTYCRDDVYVVTQALGHNRLDVTITHYLKS
ncbi:MAG: phage integrase N-terminal SAM-like domain-containing protein [Acetatifactor sp.]|nr:phage integrase N-terminal SAM-like domain-containing protein [Acetatifactor sp.]